MANTKKKTTPPKAVKTKTPKVETITKTPVINPAVNETPTTGNTGINEKNTPVVEKKAIKPLFFEQPGWCPGLERSYPKGYYSPKSQEEYDALKEYAKEE